MWKKKMRGRGTEGRERRGVEEEGSRLITVRSKALVSDTRATADTGGTGEEQD